MRTLIIPDIHASPDYKMDHCKWLSRYIIDEMPDTIVDLGDRADMASLSSYDVGMVSGEGKRYRDDIKAAKKCTRLLNSEIDAFNKKSSKWKKKMYKPDRYLTIGNHEERINIAANKSPAMFGHITLDDLKYDEMDWKTVPFGETLILNDVAYKHYFTSGIMGRPIGGEHHAASLVKKNYHSCVTGHSHMRSFYETLRADGKKVFGLVAGCYFPHDMTYTNESGRYWRGVVMLDDYGGTSNPHFISLDYIKKNYS